MEFHTLQLFGHSRCLDVCLCKPSIKETIRVLIMTLALCKLETPEMVLLQTV